MFSRLKHIILLLSALLLSAYAMAFPTWDGTSASVWTQGSGTQADPYLIESAENLAYLAQQVNSGTSYIDTYFKLDASLDLNSQEWTPIGATSTTAFAGIVDGNGKVVYNLKVSGERSYYGLFGFMLDGGAVSDIVVENCDIQVTNNQSITSDIYVGAIAARMDNPSVTIQNCYATGKVVVNNPSGEKCTVYDTHKLYEGGLFGSLQKATVKLCYNNVDFSSQGNGSVGGIVGAASGTSITECYNKAVIRGKAIHAGILGESTVTSTSDKNSIIGCYNSGEIKFCDTPDAASNLNGGICGYAGYTDIKSCYTVGTMENKKNVQNYAISLKQSSTSKREKIFYLKGIKGLDYYDSESNGTAAYQNQLQSTSAPSQLGSSYYIVDLLSTFNSGYPINRNGTYKTVTEDVTLVAEGVVLLDATAYAHNSSDRGIWFGLKSNPLKWTKYSTKSSTLNQYQATGLKYDVMYGYKAYQIIRGSIAAENVYGEERYFEINKVENCAGLPYVYHGKTFTQPGYFSVVDGNTTYLLDLRDVQYHPQYTIKFIVEGVESTVDVICGETPAYPGGTPEKPGTKKYSYPFIGWDPEIVPAGADATYTAQFKTVINKYKIVFKDYNGTEIQSDSVEYDAIPTAPADPERPATEEFTYKFKAWDPAVVSVTDDAVYLAKYDSVKNKYPIYFQNYDNTLLQDKEFKVGEMPVFEGQTPVKPNTAQYTYSFKAWEPELVKVTGPAVYKAAFDSVVNKYSIVFKDYNGTELQKSDLEYGTVPTPPANPERKATAEYTYTFKGWKPAVVSVTANAEYVASYDSVKNKYLIRFLDEDGTELQSEELYYGETPRYKGETPSKENTPQYTYTFAGWSPTITPITTVTKAQDYTATYTATVNKYTVEFKNYDGTVLQTSEVEYGKKPVYTGNTPKKESSVSYIYYIFEGWDPEIVEVTTDATYTAQFSEHKINYLILFHNYDGTQLQMDFVAHGDTPQYRGEIPERPETEKASYTFSGWAPEIRPADGSETYVAQFTETRKTVPVTFVNYDGTVLETVDVEYDSIPRYSGAKPEKPESEYAKYTFCKWLPEIEAVTGPATYKAYYSVRSTPPSISNCYSYTWKGRTTQVTTTLVHAEKDPVSGCDSIIFQHIIIMDSTVVTLPYVGDCYSYTWEGQTTYKSCRLRKVDVGKNGCDSITYLPVIIYDKPEVFITDTVSPGIAYKRNGFDLEPINELGEYEFVNEDKSVYDCDSTTYLTLKVVPDTSIPIVPAKYVQYIGGRFNWQIKNAESFPNMHVIIFDRYSRKLREYHGYSNSDGWDGTYNGHIMPSTDYWYWIKDDNFGIVTGHFLLHYDHKW